MTSIVVRKYGGSSVATPEAIRRVAREVAAAREAGHQLVVVVSAMADGTDRLMRLACEVAPNPARRELDLLLSTGELVSISLLAMALRALGHEAVALTGAQCGVITNAVHTNARIGEIRPGRILAELEQGRIVVAAGFQGVSADGEVTTLGRGGSDTTAVALAAALNAERCEICTDVSGVFSADPRLVPEAAHLPELPYETMQEMAWHGARVLNAEAVELARSNGVPLRVRASFNPADGTLVHGDGGNGAGPSYHPRQPPVAGVAGRRDLVQVALPPRPLQSELTRLVVESLAGYELHFVRWGEGGSPCHLFLSTEEIPDVPALMLELDQRFGGEVVVSDGLGAVSLIGFGSGSRPETFLAAARTLAEAGLRPREVFSKRGSLSFVLADDEVDAGVRALHRLLVDEGPG